MTATLPRITVSGTYALFDGTWLAADVPGRDRPVLVREVSDRGASAGFRPTPTPTVFAREVDRHEVQRIVRVKTHCWFRGIGPFLIVGPYPDPTVGAGGGALLEITYDGDDRDSAARLPGFVVGDQYSGRQISGTVSASEVTNVTEDVTEIEV